MDHSILALFGQVCCLFARYRNPLTLLGYTVFPDWRSAATQAWWTYELKNWFSKISFDGIWVDMSEVSSFCVGSCGTGHVTENPVNPPFLLGKYIFGELAPSS